MSPLEPRALSHYLTALLVAKLSPADVASTFASAVDARELMAKVATLAIPDAVKYLQCRFT